MVRIHEYVDEGLGHSSYLIDIGDGTAAVLDPPRFPTAQLETARRHQLTIAWTVDTHSHADYVTGSPSLSDATGAVFVAPAASRLDVPHRPVGDGDDVALAPDVTLTAIATPGHTPDHHAYLLRERGTDVALFSGGSLMVGTVGRTDLCGPDLTEPLAHHMYRSLRRLDDAFDDDLVVYPTHGAGSFCSAPGGSARTTTLGHERATNPLLRELDEAAFVDRLLSGFGSFPAYFARLPELNRRGPRRYDAIPMLDVLELDEFDRHRRAGAVVVDVRPIHEFADGHLPGSISNALRPVFASWLGWLIDRERPILFVAADDTDRTELVRQCLDIGHEHLLGELGGGTSGWVTAGRPLGRIPLVDVDRVAPTLLDVRQMSEWATGHVPGATHVELGRLAVTGSREIAEIAEIAEIPDGPTTVMCGHGERAMTAASLLAAHGRRDITVLDGGPDAWANATGRPLETHP